MRTVLITGASSGIGEACALELANRINIGYYCVPEESIDSRS